MNLLNLAKSRFRASGRLGRRGLIYTLVSLVFMVVELIRFGLARPFPLVMWLIIIGIGLWLIFFMTDTTAN
jgi:hypothetical protein